MCWSCFKWPGAATGEMKVVDVTAAAASQVVQDNSDFLNLMCWLQEPPDIHAVTLHVLLTFYVYTETNKEVGRWDPGSWLGGYIG